MINAIILAAGKGSRMKSELPKVAHRIAGAPMLVHCLRLCDALGVERRVIVTGHRADKVEEIARAYDADTQFARQQEQLGTANAVAQAEDKLAGAAGDALVLYGDTPFIEADTIRRMQEARQQGADLVVLGFVAADPSGYGRLFEQEGKLEAIIEDKEANAAQRAIDLCNSGVMMADAAQLFSLIGKVNNDNAKGEYYLTDIVAIANAAGLVCKVVRCSEEETLGVDSRADLANAEQIYQQKRRAEALADGVTLNDPQSIYFSFDTVIGRDVTVGANVVFGPDVTVESGAEIREFCHLEGCHVAQSAQIGPFARLRPGAEIHENARVGNFVEVKNADVAMGAKINHLSYIGDAEIGEGSNIGAGTITCNYDGVSKHKTKLGKRVFIGSNSALVAPINIGDDAMVAAGSTITEDVPAEALALARARQANKAGLAKRLFEHLRKMKKGKL